MKDKKTIEIQWLSDYYDCETCGGNGAQGAIVWVDGEEILNLQPIAHCYDDTTYSESDVYKLILEHLGYEIKETE